MSTLGTRETHPPVVAHRMALLGTENAFKIGPRIQAVEQAGHRVIRCNIGEPDFPLPAGIREEVKRQLDLDRTHYCDPQGVLPLRMAVAKTMGPPRGLSISPDRVVVFPGAKPPIGFCQQVYCDPDDEVIYPSPGFPIYESFTRFVGARPVPLHLREEAGFTFRPSDLERLITNRTKLIYINFPSNPTGGVASEGELREIAEVIARRAPRDARVYSDEVYESILFDGNTHFSIASQPGMAERTIIVSGVSKTNAWTGGRVGWAVFPTREEAEHFRNMNINYFSCVPEYNQLGARYALESGKSAEESALMVASFQERRDRVLEDLNRIPGVTCQKPRGAFYLFPNVGGVCESLGAVSAYRSLAPEARARTSPSTLLQLFLLDRYQVATLDRPSFGRIGAEGKHYLRISIATGAADLAEATRRIGLAACDRRGFATFLGEGSWRS